MRKMNRVLTGCLIVSLGALAGCLAPPPPSGYMPATLVSVSTTAPVLAGGAFRIDAVVNDDEGIESVSRPGFLGVNGNQLPSNYCDDWFITHQGTGARLNVTCHPPSFMTTGTWSVQFDVYDVGGYTNLHVATTIKVTGGSSDVSAPVLDSAVSNPSVIHPGDTTYVVVRASDENGPIDFGYSAPTFLTEATTDNRYVLCSQYGYGWVTPTMDQITYRCVSTLVNPPGTYTATIIATDKLGYRLPIPLSFEIVT